MTKQHVLGRDSLNLLFAKYKAHEAARSRALMGDSDPAEHQEAGEELLSEFVNAAKDAFILRDMLTELLWFVVEHLDGDATTWGSYFGVQERVDVANQLAQEEGYEAEDD